MNSENSIISKTQIIIEMTLIFLKNFNNTHKNNIEKLLQSSMSFGLSCLVRTFKNIKSQTEKEILKLYIVNTVGMMDPLLLTYTNMTDDIEIKKQCNELITFLLPSRNDKCDTPRIPIIRQHRLDYRDRFPIKKSCTFPSIQTTNRKRRDTLKETLALPKISENRSRSPSPRRDTLHIPSLEECSRSPSPHLRRLTLQRGSAIRNIKRRNSIITR